MQPEQQQQTEQAQIKMQDDAGHQANGVDDEHWEQEEAQRLQEYAQAAVVGGDPEVEAMQEDFQYENGDGANQPALTTQQPQQQGEAVPTGNGAAANGLNGPAGAVQGIGQGMHQGADATEQLEGDDGRGIPLDAGVEPSKKRAAYTCEMCGEAVAKYCCPGCSCRTCSLACSKKHKVERDCDGKRDRLAFVSLDQFDDRQLLSDYRLLEEVGRVGDVAHRCRPPAAKPQLPPHLANLVYQADRRRVKLMIMSPGMHRRRSNTTRYDMRTRRLSWRVEWLFQKAGQRVVDEQLAEDVVLSEALSRHIKWQPGAAARQFPLAEYTDAGVTALKVFMRKERTPANAAVYYAIDINRPLGSQLAGKLVVEFPVLVVALPGEESQFPSAFVNRRQQPPHQPQPSDALQHVQQKEQVQMSYQNGQAQTFSQIMQHDNLQGQQQTQPVQHAQPGPVPASHGVQQLQQSSSADVQPQTSHRQQPHQPPAPPQQQQQQQQHPHQHQHQQYQAQRQPQQHTVQQSQQRRSGQQVPTPSQKQQAPQAPQQQEQQQQQQQQQAPAQLQHQGGAAGGRTGTVVGRVMQPMKLSDRAAPVQQPPQHKPGGVMLPLKRGDVAPPAQGAPHKPGGVMLPLKAVSAPAPQSVPHKPGSVMTPQRAGAAPTAAHAAVRPPLHVAVPQGGAPNVRPGAPGHALPSPTTPPGYPQGNPVGAPPDPAVPTGPHPHYLPVLAQPTTTQPAAPPPAGGPPPPHYYPPQPAQHQVRPPQQPHQPQPAHLQAPYSHVRPHSLQPGAPPPGSAPHHPPPGAPPAGPALHHPPPGAYPTTSRPPALQHGVPPPGSLAAGPYIPPPAQPLHAHRPPGLAIPHAGAPQQHPPPYGQLHSPHSQLPSPQAQHPGPPYGIHMHPPHQQHPQHAAWPPGSGPYQGAAPYGAHAHHSGGGGPPPGHLQGDANEIPL